MKKLTKFDKFDTVVKEDKIVIPKIEVICKDCGKKFNTTQEWFDTHNKDGKLPCIKCRMGSTTIKKDTPPDNTKIEVICKDCGKKFSTTQNWFDIRNKDGKLPCRKCR